MATFQFNGRPITIDAEIAKRFLLTGKADGYEITFDDGGGDRRSAVIGVTIKHIDSGIYLTYTMELSRYSDDEEESGM